MTRLFFYELHEGATDLLTDAILVSEQEHSPQAFAAMVAAARAAVVDTFEEDTLVEAIARELERSHGFNYASDEKLTASMAVGLEADDTFLVETSTEFRSLIAEVDLSS
jgi:DNA-binding NarL/FixJ family response regulator